MSSKIFRLRRQSNIFISYRRQDSSGHTGRLFDALSGHFAGRLFMDVDTLEPGVDFAEAIEQAVGSCEVLIVVIGREWLTIKDAAGQRRLDDPADFVRLEVETALERKIRVIPVLVQGAPMPRTEELPPSLSRLARRNAIELSDARWAYDVDRLARTIQKILEEMDASALALTAAMEMTVAPPARVVPAVEAEAVAPPAPVIPEVAAEAVAPPTPVIPKGAAKAAISPARLLFLAALVLVAAGLASFLWMRRSPSGNTTLSSLSDSSEKRTGADSYQGTAGSIERTSSGGAAASDLKLVPPQTPVSMRTAMPQQTTILQPVPRPSSPSSTPPAPSTPAVSKPSVPSPLPSSTDREVVIPMQLAGEGRGRREKEEPMKKGDLIMDGPGVEEPQPSATPPAMYPPSVASGQYARVVLDVLVDENGAVADARVSRVDDGSADAEFRNAALAAARQARFEPATKHGIAGKMWWGGALTYEFGKKK
ncbi:MAG TPA: TonB family protein [Thermoanaerobaculia bacterium]|nr:TonB family protein [Thermoanaerobaculia bacterium]